MWKLQLWLWPSQTLSCQMKRHPSWRVEASRCPEPPLLNSPTSLKVVVMCQCWTLIKACLKKKNYYFLIQVDSMTQLLHPWSESPVPLHPKGALLVWYPVTVEAVWVQWTVMFKNWVSYDFNFVAWRVIVLEMAIRRRVQCRHTAMDIVSNSTHMWMWCLNDDQWAQSVLIKYYRYTTIFDLNHW